MEINGMFVGLNWPCPVCGHATSDHANKDTPGYGLEKENGCQAFSSALNLPTGNHYQNRQSN